MLVPAAVAATYGYGGQARPVAPRPVARPHRAVAHKPARLVVNVIDGDQWLRVPHALVRLWGRSARTDRHGAAEIRVPWRRGLNITVQAAGFETRTVWEQFDRFRRVTVRIYRPELQWPLYGATDSRSQAQAHIRLRPPFHTVWAVPMGGLIEFPAVVDQGVAYIGNAKATVRAISMLSGRVLWRHDTPHAAMASSPAVAGRDLVYHSLDGHVYVLDRGTGKLRWSYGIGSATASTTSAPGTAVSTRSTCAGGGCAGRAISARRSPRAPRSSAARSTSATTAAACGRCPRARAGPAGRGP